MKKFIVSLISNCLRFHWFQLLTFALFLCYSCQLISAQTTLPNNAPESIALELNKPIERELKGGETHSYTISVERNQFLRVIIDQREVDVAITLYAPDGQLLAELNSPNEAKGIEPVSFIAKIAGVYRLNLRDADKDALAGGSYEIKIKELRETREPDEKQIAAERLLSEATAAARKGTKESMGQAIKLFADSAVIFRSLNDVWGEATASNMIGEEFTLLGENQPALKNYQQALELWQKSGDLAQEAAVLTNLAALYGYSGDTQKALELNNKSLLLRRATGNQRGEALTLSNIGYIYHALGEEQKAFDAYNAALLIQRKIGDRIGEGIALGNIAAAYDQLGSYEQAIEYYNQSLTLARTMGNRRTEAVSLHNLATVYRTLNQLEKARDYLNQALPIWREIGYRFGEAASLSALGTSYHLSGDEAKAIENFNSALTLRRALEDRNGEANTLTNIGISQAALGDTAKALETFNQSLAISRAVKDRKQQAETLYQIALVKSSSGNLNDALTYVEAALGIIESLRSNVTSPNLRASYFATTRKHTDLWIDLLMRLNREIPNKGYESLALQASEQGRARSLLDLLREAHADIRTGIDPKLLERERAERQSLNDKAQNLAQLNLNKSSSGQEQKALNDEIKNLTVELEQVEAQIRESSPRYAALTQSQPVSVKQIQNELLDKDTILLEYSLGAERSYLWLVTPDKIETFELPKRETIETQARQFYQLLTARNEQTPNETTEQRRSRIARAETEFVEASANLSQTILAPVAAKLTDKRLLIVADGALQYVPFAALASPKSKTTSDRGQATKDKFLGETNEIVNLPSASVLAQLRRDETGRTPALKTLAVFADPVFSFDDARLASARNKTFRAPSGETADSRAANINSKPIASSAAPQEVTRAFADLNVGANGLQIPRLPFSRREAQNILALAPKNQTLSALDFSANLDAARSPQLADYRIVHFATHGVLDGVHPELSGIVLSLVDENGKTQDGFLRLNEIYNLKLPADLVVLSACQTALGKDIKGEGLIGLTRGFMYAGAPRVVASLWKVDDAATAELMRLFYQKMLKENARPAAALRAAKLEMAQNARWSAPYYWAAFTLQGEWK
ncbi:MAG: CHAT domain-containing protein [Acidobacteriota bacterium]|nr:CHAT domain-containing protein [Acidobacteriota bacterium]